MGGILSFILIIGLLASIGYVSRKRKWYKVMKGKPEDFAVFTTTEPLSTVIDRIIQVAEKNSYNIVDVNRELNRIILGKHPSSFGIGFFFPIYITETKEKTLVEIGVVPTIHLLRSKFASDRNQKKVFDMIKDSLKGF